MLGDDQFAANFPMTELLAHNVGAVFEQYGARKRRLHSSQGKQIDNMDHPICYEKPRKPAWISQASYAALYTITISEVDVGLQAQLATVLDLATTIACPG